MSDTAKTMALGTHGQETSPGPRPFEKPIYVTRPFLPPIEEFAAGLQEIWDTQWLTNNGPVQRFARHKCTILWNSYE